MVGGSLCLPDADSADDVVARRGEREAQAQLLVCEGDCLFGVEHTVRHPQCGSTGLLLQGLRLLVADLVVPRTRLRLGAAGEVVEAEA